MAKFEFTHSRLGQVYGVMHPQRGQVVELDPAFAADGVSQGILKPVEPVEDEAPAKRGRPRKAE